jgi:hypothetical protein
MTEPVLKRVIANASLGFVEPWDWSRQVSESLESLRLRPLEMGRSAAMGPEQARTARPIVRVRYGPLGELMMAIKSWTVGTGRERHGYAEILNRIQPLGLTVTAFSPSHDPMQLSRDALDCEALIDRIMADQEGVIVDHVALFWMSFTERQRLLNLDLGLRRLFHIHAVKTKGYHFLHTHGMVKFACPDLEWYLPSGFDPTLAGQVINQIATSMVDRGLLIEAGQTLRSEDGRITLRCLPAISRQNHDYGQNRVVRLEAMPGSEWFSRNGQILDRRDLTREEYFHGRAI